MNTIIKKFYDSIGELINKSIQSGVPISVVCIILEKLLLECRSIETSILEKEEDKK